MTPVAAAWTSVVTMNGSDQILNAALNRSGAPAPPPLGALRPAALVAGAFCDGDLEREERRDMVGRAAVAGRRRADPAPRSTAPPAGCDCFPPKKMRLSHTLGAGNRYSPTRCADS